MGRLRAQHVFVGAMACAAVSAFLVPSWTASKRPRLEAVFAPVSRPSAAAARWVRERFVPPGRDRDDDARTADDVRAENEHLRAAVAYLAGQVRDLTRVNNDRASMGRAWELCTPVRVVGGDAGAAQSLGIMPAADVRAGQVVLYPGGVVGVVQDAGVGGARVRLITDREFAIGGLIGVLAPDAGGLVPRSGAVVPLVGAGNNQLTAKLTKAEAEAQGIAAGDVVVLNDARYADDVQGMTLGRIREVRPRREVLWVDVVVEPTTVLNRLDDVLVLTGTRGLAMTTPG